MPRKDKAAAKPKEPEVPKPAPPKTINEQSRQRYEQLNPLGEKIQDSGLSSLSPAERTNWANSHYLRASSAKKLPNKVQKELWRNVNEASLPLRTLKKPTTWGKDRNGYDVGGYTLEKFQERTNKRITLTALEALHQAFLDKRDLAERKIPDSDTQELLVVGDEDIEEEIQRRKAIAQLRMELYGQTTDPYSQDPTWDDVVPIPVEEPEGALAAIAYPENYAEAISYLRAVIAAEEYSPRCLRLTEHVISMNPAHYTVWLYRFSIITALQLSIPSEIGWVNEVALRNLKNYQIWHHRHLLIDAYHTQIAASPDKVADLARSETAFLDQMLDQDTKNYHVWSYRQYLVRKLGNWTAAELASTEAFIDLDVRNNSAWSHRFFLVFSDPNHSTPDAHSSDPDPAVPSHIIDREVAYAQQKIKLAPQNQSPWFYLKAVLAKGGRKLGTVEEFATQFVKNIGGDGEDVQSTHAMDLLAEVYTEQGNKEKAELYLTRLGEKWDQIRAGYWEWRKRALADGSETK